MAQPEHNNIGYICITSLVLGFIVGTSLVYRSRLSFYFIIVCIFHLNEFLSNCVYSQSTHHSFLIWYNRGSREYWMVQMMTMVEYMYFRRYTIGGGIVVSMIGIFLRHLSIKTLGKSFSHYIKTDKYPLVTTGIFQYIRHPSYLGFYVYVIGIEIYLRNYISFIVCVGILTYFFRKRIQFEEYWLEKNHREYNAYKQKVRIYIPFV
ncbi:protein-S-isoprenylcysteine O-methyltransferase [[Candida] jaroonii]|uniref:Protein-S-isoprenylcysteine O-methyltransferase n=1 Tax=[Candida] jaroonii TaxID=467808 RepID=A0ACA9Y4D3_9ASCO|nr:protein-S-isoprenylcysteine O-methyltransferase [[Candida] jaroonii]